MTGLIEYPIKSGRMNVHRFFHKAMATEFAVWICHQDARYAGQAAWDAFRLLDLLDAQLNRFETSSEISRLNAAASGETVQLDESAYACLSRAIEVYSATEGAFDVTAGGLKDFWLGQPSLWRRMVFRFVRRLLPIGMNRLHLEPKDHAVRKDGAVQIDLGAIGKGFAVDRMIALLDEWDVRNVMVHGGASSAAARGMGEEGYGWPVVLHHPNQPQEILGRFYLKDGAIGASGLRQGGHIIDPRTGRPAKKTVSSWVTAPDAAMADAISTAAMVMTPSSLDRLLRRQPQLGFLVVRRDGRKETILRKPEGHWPRHCKG